MGKGDRVETALPAEAGPSFLEHNLELAEGDGAAKGLPERLLGRKPGGQPLGGEGRGGEGVAELPFGEEAPEPLRATARKERPDPLDLDEVYAEVHRRIRSRSAVRMASISFTARPSSSFTTR